MSLNGINFGDDNNDLKSKLGIKSDGQSLQDGKNISISFDNNDNNLKALQALKGTQSSDDISALLTSKSESSATVQTTANTQPAKTYATVSEMEAARFEEEIKNPPKEEYSTEPLTEQQISEYMQLFGKTREQVLADHEKSIKQYKEWNKKLSETKASNGMSLPEAKRVYMELYHKYIKQCGVRVPWVLHSDAAAREGAPDGAFVGGLVADVDPAMVESKMTSAEREQFQKAKAAIAELEQNPELMEIYKYSSTAFLERTFGSAHIGEGMYVEQWQNTAAKWGVNPEDEIIRRPWGV